MNIMKSSFHIITDVDEWVMLRRIEAAARTCYKSEGNVGSFEKTKRFVHKLLHQHHHESVIEHEVISVRIVCDRGISHELVRHRLASYSQESSRYVCYGKDKHGGSINVITPGDLMTNEQLVVWARAMYQANEAYLDLLAAGATPEMARSVLPQSTKTEIVVTMNLRNWRHFFKLRTSPSAHPQMREIAAPLLAELKVRLPVIFDDL